MINFRFLINLIFVVLILHLIIKHFDKTNLGMGLGGNHKSLTPYSVEELNEYLDEMDKPGQENFESRAEMVREIETEVNMPEPVKPLTPVDAPKFPVPSNNFTTDANTPNFTSNVMNIKNLQVHGISL